MIHAHFDGTSHLAHEIADVIFKNNAFMNQLKNCLGVATFVCFALLQANAATIYLADSATGDGSGNSPSNRQSVSAYNNTGGAHAGDTLSLAGTITTYLIIGANGPPPAGTLGNPITVLWESGAKLSQPAGSLIQCGGSHFIVFDGGANGIIENTDNGSGLGNQMAVYGINASGSDNLEVKNLTFRNFFVPSGDPLSLPPLTFSSNGALYMNGYGSNISIHNCSFSNICWILYLGGGSGSGVNIYSNNFVNYDHAIASLGDHMSNVNIFNNHFGSTAIWDSGTNNYFHHDGIHIFFGSGSTLQNVKIYNNLFDGDWGENNTAHIFAEGDFSHNNPDSEQYFTIYNNVFIQPTNSHALNNGFLSGWGSSWRIFNNTFVGANVYNQNAMSIGGTNTMFVNNLVQYVDTFVSITGPTNGMIISNNVYAVYGAGGNPPFSINGVSPIYNFAAWQVVVVDANSSYSSAASVNADGTIPSGSPAIGAGANLSSIFTTDYTGATRTAPWTIGAYQYGIAQTGSALSVTPANQDFGAVAVGTTTNQNMIVQNIGGGMLTGSASVAAPFSIVSGGTYNLAAGQSQPVTVSYSPTATGTNVQTVTFSGGAGASAPLIGTAVLPPPVVMPPGNLQAFPVGQ